MKQWALVRTYNFDLDVKVWLFDIEEEACNYMEFLYDLYLETERKEYADHDPDKVYKNKCFCDKESGISQLAWRNDETSENPNEYDYCLLQVQKVEEV